MRSSHLRDDPVRHALRLLRRRVVLEEHRELVAGEARDRVAGTYAAPYPLRHRPEQPIAHGVAEALVDRLEAVDVEHEHRESVVGAARLEGDGLPDAVHEERAV